MTKKELDVITEMCERTRKADARASAAEAERDALDEELKALREPVEPVFVSPGITCLVTKAECETPDMVGRCNQCVIGYWGDEQ